MTKYDDSEARTGMTAIGGIVQGTADDILARWEREIEAMPDDSQDEPPAKPRHIDKVPPFLTDGLHAEVLEAHQQALEYTRAIINRSCRPYSLSLLGGSGCGKTHLARVVQATLWDAKVECQIWKWGEVLNAIRYNRGEFLRHLDSLRVLILDDVGAEFIGTEKALDFSFSKLCEMLETRSRKWTMLTSNLTMRQIADVETRCASRLIRNGGRVVQMHDAPDWALAHRLQQNSPTK